MGRKTPKITEVLPLLYLHGLSTGDFVPALGQLWGAQPGSVGRSAITRLTEAWQAEQRRVRSRGTVGIATRTCLRRRPTVERAPW